MTTVLDQLQNISRDLDAAIRDLSRLEQESADAESAYRVTKAKAFMRASGSVQAREYQAVIESEIQLINRDKSAALVRIQRELCMRGLTLAEPSLPLSERWRGCPFDYLGRRATRPTVTCYARACRQRRPCASSKSCERVWHLCDTSRFRSSRANCPVCGAIWTTDLKDGGTGGWYREPKT